MAGYDVGDLLLRGALAGLIGAIVMGTVGVAFAALQGPSFGVPMSIVAATAIRPGAGSALVLLGSVLHLLEGAVLGAIFAVVVPKRARVPTILGLSLAYGLVVHLVTFYGVLRPLQLVERTARVDTWWFLSEHLAYGLTVGIVLSAWFSAQRSERTVRPA